MAFELSKKKPFLKQTFLIFYEIEIFRVTEFALNFYVGNSCGRLTENTHAHILTAVNTCYNSTH